MKKILLLVVLGITPIIWGPQGTWGAILKISCVDPSGSGDYTDLQSALDDAGENKGPDLIKVAQGTYTTTEGFNYFSLQDYSITLQGGYEPGTDCAIRVTDPSRTILDGGGNSKVLRLSHDGLGSITVDGFTIQNGMGSSYSSGGGLGVISNRISGVPGDITVTNNIFIGNSAYTPNGPGGGVYATSSGETESGMITISNNTFSGNDSPDGVGGGIYAETYGSSGVSGAITILGNTCTGNYAESDGGGIYARSYSDLGAGGNITIRNNTLSENKTVKRGGGVFALSDGETGSGMITLSNNTVTGNNSADEKGGGIYAYSRTYSGFSGAITIQKNTCTGNYAESDGGGIYANSSSSLGAAGDITVQENTCSENTTGGLGGGMYVQAWGETGSGKVSIEKNTCTRNTADSAGGVDASSNSVSGTAGAVLITGNTVSGNIATGGEGGIDASSLSYSGTAGPVTLVNNIVSGNTAGSLCGGVNAKSTGDATSAVTLTNNTITQNIASQVGGADLRSDENNVYVYNNIIWGNTGDDIVLRTSPSYGYHNDYSSFSGTWDFEANNLNADPKFVSIGYWDSSVWVAGNYHLRRSSPCIDKGLNTAPQIPDEDFDGNERILGDKVDIGADEYTKISLPGILPLLLD
jgi:hypothetical protein